MADQGLTQWIFSNICKASKDEFIDFTEVQSKNGKVTNKKFGNLISNIFPHITIKRGRNRSNWAGKLTQRYYGLSWIDKENVDTSDSSVKGIDLEAIPALLPEGFFFLSKNENGLCVGHFCGLEINKTKVLTEIALYKNGTWSISALGTTINPKDICVANSFSLESIRSVFDTVQNVRYCSGVRESETNSLDNESNFYVEQFCNTNQNISVIKRYRSKLCKVLIPFHAINTMCSECKSFKKLKSEPKPVLNEIEANNNVAESSCDSTGDGDKNVSGEVTLCESDHNDMKAVFQQIFPECGDKMSSFLLSQKQALERKPNGRRWNADIIRLCLTLWCRSPRGYSDLRKSGFMLLPSEKILQIHKNVVHQEAGINKDMMHWMANEAKVQNIPPEGYVGGLLLDEMSIQPDLQFSVRNGDIELIGFKEVVPESLVMDELKTKKREKTLATHALQFVFLGLTGFRFPIAHFPTTTASEYELYLLWGP